VKTCYVVTDKISTIVFEGKEAAEKFLANMILSKVKDINFCVSAFQSFCVFHSNTEIFLKKLERLVALAREESSLNVDELVTAWNDVFPGSAIDVAQAEFVQTSKE
jgi:hypothetical protein